jgi:hypothetical protein
MDLEVRDHDNMSSQLKKITDLLVLVIVVNIGRESCLTETYETLKFSLSSL